MDLDVEEIRRRAGVEAGRLAIEERFGSPKLAAVDAILLQKSAAAISTDNELLKVAAALRPGNPLAAYEELGGTYGGVKEAVSTEGIRKVVSSASEHASPERLKSFAGKMQEGAYRVGKQQKDKETVWRGAGMMEPVDHAFREKALKDADRLGDLKHQYNAAYSSSKPSYP